MHAHYPLFRSHLDLAHQYWQRIVLPGDLVIDATCGNGRDTLNLCKLALANPPLGKVYAIDIQPDAISSTKTYLTSHLSEEQITLVEYVHGSHAHFPDSIKPETVKLIVYNLGYLPGGDKTKITEASTTLTSLQEAQNLLQPGGIISITCYPGHSGGDIEEELLLGYAKNLDPAAWNTCHHRWLNRSRSPSLLILQKSIN